MGKETIPAKKMSKEEKEARIKEVGTTLAEIAGREKSRTEREKSRIKRDEQAREDIRRATEAANRLSEIETPKSQKENKFFRNPFKKETIPKSEKNNEETIPETLEEIEIPKKLTDEEIIKEFKKLPEIEKETKIPENAGEAEVETEIKKLPLEDREKIGWGLSTIGFKVEKTKNDFFAKRFNSVMEDHEIGGKKIKGIDKKGTVGRFCTELRDSFIRDSKAAVKKANDAAAFTNTKLGINIWGKKRGINISAEKQKALSNWGNFSGNLLRYGRAITDLTGASLASPLRYVMMAGMATTRLAEAGKEARLKNEEVIEKTRIQDVDRAYEEAQKIYERAQAKEKTENVSVEALKNAYMMEMPKDLQKRLENPNTANSLIQKIIKADIEEAMTRLNNSIEKIEKDGKLSLEQKEIKKEKLLIKQNKNLEDYDRIITQYGTVDALAMAGHYAQTVGKTVVAVVTVETLLLSADKICETISNLYHHFHDAPKVFTFEASDPKAFLTTLPHKVEPMPAQNVSASEHLPTSAAGSPETPSAIKDFTNEGIKFEKGKGGIQGILDLKEQIRTQYGGDYSKAPESVREFMNTDAAKEAIKLGIFDPSNSSGKESALIVEDSVLKFDEQGNLLFGKPDTSGKIPVLEKYQGKMLDSDGSAKISKISTTEPVTKFRPETATTETPTPEPTTAEMLKKQIETHLDAETEKMNTTEIREATVPDSLVEKPNPPAPQNTPSNEIRPDYQTMRTGTKYDTGSEVYTGSEIYSSGYNKNPSSIFEDRYSEYPEQFPNLSHGDNLILQYNPEFADNPFGLSGEKLMKVHEDYYENANYLFKEELFRNKDGKWLEALDSQKASITIEHTIATDGETPTGKFGSYLEMLKNFSRLEPKSGFLGFGSETTKHYIVRAMQKLMVDGKLEIFQESLRR